jgi:Ftsk gamma domain
MKNFDLNIDKILENWEVFHAVRELLANAIDEQILTSTAKPEIYRDSVGWWHIRDFGRGLRYQDLIQSENPEKLGHSNLIGKFGIGLKDALATFDRRGIHVVIHSRHGDISLTRVSKHSFDDLITLHAVVADPVDSNLVGTDCCMYGISESDIDAAKRLFLSFSDDTVIEETRYGAVYPLRQQTACIYINGMKVAEESNFLFSYNITSLNATIRKALNRERQNLGRSAYSERIRSILLACESESVAEVISDDLLKHISGDSHDELAWLDVQEHAARILSAKRKVLFLSSTQALLHPDIVESARSGGFHVLTVPDALTKKIEGITNMAGQPVTEIKEFLHQYNESFQFKWVLPSELSDAELAIWQHTERILSYIGGQPEKVHEIRISETMSAGTFSGHNTIGLWVPEKSWIVVKRSVLQKLEDYAGILLHEALHAKYALLDVSRDFESHLTELCGTLAAKIIQVGSGLDSHVTGGHAEAQFAPELDAKLSGKAPAEMDISEDDKKLIYECFDVIRQEKKASTSMLQRRLRLGYDRAAYVIDYLEKVGVLGPADGAKPREILVDLQSYLLDL